MKIIYRLDGVRGVIGAAPQESVAALVPEVAAMTELQYMEWVRDRSVPEGATDVQIVEDSDVPLDYPAIISAAHSRINRAYENAVNALTAGYPQTEIASWPKQETEARAYLADETANTPWLKGAAAGRGINVPNFAALVIRNADALAPLHGQLTGKRQSLRDEITALGDTPTQEQLDAIVWP